MTQLLLHHVGSTPTGPLFFFSCNFCAQAEGLVPFSFCVCVVKLCIYATIAVYRPYRPFLSVRPSILSYRLFTPPLSLSVSLSLCLSSVPLQLWQRMISSPIRSRVPRLAWTRAALWREYGWGWGLGGDLREMDLI